MPSSQTKITAIRLDVEQIAALKRLPPKISKSILVRTLLREYLAGRLPHIHQLVLKEADETAEAVSASHQLLQDWKQKTNQKLGDNDGSNPSL